MSGAGITGFRRECFQRPFRLNGPHSPLFLEGGLYLTSRTYPLSPLPVFTRRKRSKIRVQSQFTLLAHPIPSAPRRRNTEIISCVVSHTLLTADPAETGPIQPGRSSQGRKGGPPRLVLDQEKYHIRSTRSLLGRTCTRALPPCGQCLVSPRFEFSTRKKTYHCSPAIGISHGPSSGLHDISEYGDFPLKPRL